jgi:hypothetical protein
MAIRGNLKSKSIRGVVLALRRGAREAIASRTTRILARPDNASAEWWCPRTLPVGVRELTLFLTL